MCNVHTLTVAAHRQHENLEGWLEGKREPWLAQLREEETRQQVEDFLDEAIEDAQAKLEGRAVQRPGDHAIRELAAIMGRRLRGMFGE